MNKPYLFQKGRAKTGGRRKGSPVRTYKRLAASLAQQKAIDGIFEILAALPLDAPGRDKAMELYTQMKLKVKRIVVSTPCKLCTRRMAYNLQGKRGL